MRVAIFSDIHGNLVAFEAMLAALAPERPDQLLCLGDVATAGPQPVEVLTRLKALGCAVVRGNTDADLLDPPPWYANPDVPELPESARRIYSISSWCRDQLSPGHMDYIRTFPPTIEVPLGHGAAVIGFHGSPNAATDVIRATTPDTDLDQMLAGFRATVLAGGHMHVPMLRRHRQQLVLNPGSVGLPFAEYGYAGQVPLLPEAQYALVDRTEGWTSVQFRRLAIDVEAVTRAARRSEMPHAEWWINLWMGD